jgi:hypothetical protein
VPRKVAEIVVCPAVMPRTTPALDTLATAGFDDVHVARAVAFSEAPHPSQAVAVN